MMGLRPGLYQITFEWQPGHIKMAAALMDYSSLCLTALRLLAEYLLKKKKGVKKDSMFGF